MELNIDTTYIDGEQVVEFSMVEVTVDGIRSSMYNADDRASHHSANMFSYKYTGGTNVNETKDGYVSGNPDWKSPYRPVTYRHGDIDDDIYLYTGHIIGKRDPDYRLFLEEARDAWARIRKFYHAS